MISICTKGNQDSIKPLDHICFIEPTYIEVLVFDYHFISNNFITFDHESCYFYLDDKDKQNLRK